jgi:hypothetical protein
MRRFGDAAGGGARSSATPDVLEEPAVGSQPGEPVVAIYGGSRVHSEHLDECGANTRRHGVGIAAYVDVGVLILDEVPDLVGALDDRVLDLAPFRISLAGEHRLYLDHAVGLVAAQLVPVEVVVCGGAATEEQQ